MQSHVAFTRMLAREAHSADCIETYRNQEPFP